MANKKENDLFMASIAILPGDTIKENMIYLGMNQKELALRLKMSQKHLSNIINGKEPITYDTALKLETVLGPKAQFWMNLETNYQLDRARLRQEKELEEDLDIIKKIPYKHMSDLGWIAKTDNRIERVQNLREFFKVASLQTVKVSFAAMFRMQKRIKDISDFGVLAWLRKAEIEGLKVDVSQFNHQKLKSLIPQFRQLTLMKPEEFYPIIKRLCAECGVALVLVKALPKTYICGATLWRNNKAILALSVRGKRADIFWFTFFHELAHLINHTKKVPNIRFYNDKEDEADREASNYLIPDHQYKIFIEKYDYTNKMQIVNYSHEIGIAPCILVGRLLHDGKIDYKYYSDLRPSFEIIN